MKMGIECGQRFFSIRSWRGARLRRYPSGFAIGPVMFWRV